MGEGGGDSEIHRPCPPWGLRDGGLKSSKLMQFLKYSSLLLASNSQTSGMIEVSIVLSVKIVKFMDPPSGVRVLGLGSNNHFILCLVGTLLIILWNTLILCKFYTLLLSIKHINYKFMVLESGGLVWGLGPKWMQYFFENLLLLGINSMN